MSLFCVLNARRRDHARNFADRAVKTLCRFRAGKWTQMKKRSLLAVIIAAVMLSSLLTGCININIPTTPTDAPTDGPTDNTEAPATDEPVVTETPTEAPTEVPDYTPDVGGGIKFGPGESVTIDIDCDGKDDTVSLRGEVSDPELDYYTDFFLDIKLGYGMTYSVAAETDAFDAFAVIIDCDPNDQRLEILLNTTYEDDYGSILAVRVNKKGSALDHWSTGGNLYDDDYGGGAYFENGMFYIHDYTDIIGTHGIYAEWSIGDDGFYRCSDCFTYEKDWWTDDEYAPKVIKEMPGYRLNSDGTPGAKVTVKKGTILHPLYSDLETYVVVQLKDGTLIWLEISFPAERWDPYVFDHSQDYYMELPYAG